MYFVVLVRYTRERQWKRPEASSPNKDSSNRKSTRIEAVDRMSKRVASTSPEQVDRMSRRVASPVNSTADYRKSSRLSADMALLSTPTSNQANFNTRESLAQEARARGRKQRSLFLSMEVEEEEVDDIMKQSLAYMMRLGVRDKTGYLSKQSKFLGRYSTIHMT